MNQVTAVVLSKRGYSRKFRGLDLVLHYSIVNNSKDLCIARFKAVQAVKTPYFFFLDDDDDLPRDYLEVIDQCMAADAAVAYTDELIISSGVTTVIKSAEYSQELHLRNSSLIHHLALCRTSDARQIIKTLPVEPYCPEMILYWEMAKRGAKYIPLVGYVWNREIGMSTWPSTVQSWALAKNYCREHP